MRILIAHDMEGISGVVDWQHTEPGNAEYERFRRVMTAEVNAAAAGALEGGATEVVVTDGHGGGRNVLIEDLLPEIRLNSGSLSPLSMVSGADAGIDAALFVGCHARAGTAEAILAHTWSCSRVLGVWLNHAPAGEIHLNSAVCGQFGVPVLLLAGDAAACAEASALIPGIATVPVKRARGFRSAECLSPAVTQPRLRAAAAAAVRECLAGRAPQPVAVTRPVHLMVELGNPAMADAAALMPGLERLDGRRLAGEFPDVLTAYRAFRAAVALAGTA